MSKKLNLKKASTTVEHVKILMRDTSCEIVYNSLNNLLGIFKQRRNEEADKIGRVKTGIRKSVLKSRF